MHNLGVCQHSTRAWLCLSNQPPGAQHTRRAHLAVINRPYAHYHHCYHCPSLRVSTVMHPLPSTLTVCGAPTPPCRYKYSSPLPPPPPNLTYPQDRWYSQKLGVQGEAERREVVEHYITGGSGKDRGGEIGGKIQCWG